MPSFEPVDYDPWAPNPQAVAAAAPTIAPPSAAFDQLERNAGAQAQNLSWPTAPGQPARVTVNPLRSDFPAYSPTLPGATGPETTGMPSAGNRDFAGEITQYFNPEMIRDQAPAQLQPQQPAPPLPPPREVNTVETPLAASQKMQAELENPYVMDRLIAMTRAEVGNLGPEGAQKFLETIRNRAAAEGKTISQILADRRYFPAPTFRAASAPVSEREREVYGPLVQQMIAGSNSANWATGNASWDPVKRKWVGFQGGPTTATAGRGYGTELYGIEKPNLDWAKGVGYEGGQAAPYVSENETAFANAAARTARGQRPEGGRQPGLATHFLETFFPTAVQTMAANQIARPQLLKRMAQEVYERPKAALESAGSLQRGGSYDPGPVLGTAMGLFAPRVPSLAVGGGTGQAGIFGGRLSMTANHQKLIEAENLHAQGMPMDEIRSRTGWELKDDGQWRYEISDQNAKIKPGVHGSSNMFDVLDHPELREAYPHLEGTAAYADRGRVGGVYQPPASGRKPYIRVSGETPEQQRNVMLHEATHAVQDYEGFSPGTSHEDAGATAHMQFNAMSDAMDRALAKMAPGPERDALQAQRQRLDEMRTHIDERDIYRRAAGEVEARNVQTRADMTPEMRQRHPPANTEDVPRNQQVIFKPAAGPTTPRRAHEPISPVKEVDPGSLIFREREQNNLAVVRELYPKGESYDPAVAARTSDGLLLLDGHNRATVAKERGDLLPVVEIDGGLYDRLKKAGWDENDISHAVLEHAGLEDAARGIRRKFPGVDFLRNDRQIEPLINSYADPTTLRRAYEPEKGTYHTLEDTFAGTGSGERAGKSGRDAGVAEASRAATNAAGSARPLIGLPTKALTIGPDSYYVPGPNSAIHTAAEEYMRSKGLKYEPPQTYAKVDIQRAERIADEYQKMPHAPDDPKVKASYDAMIKETVDQYRQLEKMGIKFEPIPPGMPDPYAASPRLANKDFRDNKHLWYFPTDAGFGSSAADVANNPLLRMTDVVINGKQLPANDVFRIVHDVFGHFKEGVGFRAEGEENAWRSHSAMYSDAARPAMTSETRGQNSWVNYGPNGQKNRTASAADTTYADQKTGLLPDWVMNEGRNDFKPVEHDPFGFEDHPGYISTRLPTAKGAREDPFNTRLTIDVDAMKQIPKLYQHNVALVRGYPIMTAQEARLPTDQAMRTFLERVQDNVLWLHDQVPPEIAARSKLWYDGANRIVHHRAQEHGLTAPQVAGVYAALSPQKDWFQNVSLGDRLMDTYFNHQDFKMSKKDFYGLPPEMQADKYKALRAAVEGRTYKEIDPVANPLARAFWARAHDQLTRSPSHHIITPEGNYEGYVLTDAGNPAKIQWSSGVEITKALNAIESKGNIDAISKLMGMKHKVRSFYNNMLHPDAPHGDVTIDTHAVAGALLQPLGGTAHEVAHNFGNYPGKDIPAASGSAISGVDGTYPLYADPYRAAAAERKLLPRQMQSITWEAARGLFPDVSKGVENKERVRSFWNSYRKGNMTLQDVRDAILENQGGIKPPPWWTK